MQLWAILIRQLCYPRNSLTSKGARFRKATLSEAKRCPRGKQVTAGHRLSSRFTTPEEVLQSRQVWLPVTRLKCIALLWQTSIQTNSIRRSHRDTWLEMCTTTNSWARTRLEAATITPFRVTPTMFAVRCEALNEQSRNSYSSFTYIGIGKHLRFDTDTQMPLILDVYQKENY